MPESKKTVFPGQHLTVEEEYEAGSNTYADADGNVISSTSGNVHFDEDAREVRVQNAHNNAKGLEVGAIIVGRVALVKDAVAILNVGYAEKDGQRRRIYDASAVLGVARVSREFIRSMHDHFKVGDFVRAKVSGVTPYSVEISTNEKGLGKILAREDVVSKTIAGKEILPTDTTPSEHM